MVSNTKRLSKQFQAVLNILLGIITLVVALHIFWQVVGVITSLDNRVLKDVINRFGLDNELSFPTWVSSILAFVAGCMAWIVGKQQTNAKKRSAWYGTVVVLMGISIDEVSALHELILQGLHILANFGEGQGLLNNAWLLVLPFLGAGLVFAVRELYNHLPESTFRHFVLAIVVYLLGALVVEYVSIPLDKSEKIYFLGVVVLEESLELLAVWLAIRAVLIHIDSYEPELKKTIISKIL